MSSGRDYRGRDEAGSSRRNNNNNNSSRTSSHDQQRHRSGPYDATMAPTAPQEDEVNYRQEFVERRAAPVQRPTMVVDMYRKNLSSNAGASGSLDDDEVLARKLQADINAEFEVFSGDDDLPPPPPPPPRPSSRYDVAPVQNYQLPFAKLHDNYDYNYHNDYTTGATPNYIHNKFREEDEYGEFHKKASRVGARGQSARVHRSTYPNPHQGRGQDAYHDELVAAAAAEEESRRLARQLQDEEMARQLQAQQQQELLEEKEREERRRRRQRAAREEGRRSAAAAAAAAASPHAASASSSRHVHSNSNRDSRKDTRVLAPASTSSFSDSSSDMIAARRIAQEMEDAEMAHRLAQYEQEVARRNDQAANGPATRKQQLVLNRLLPLFCIALALIIGLLFVFGVFSPDSVKNGWGGIFDGKDNWVDPFAGDVNIDGDGSSPVLGKMAWPTDGQGGLQLPILFAMEDRWSSLFQTAVDNWDAGYPIDSLTLSVSRLTYEPDCVAQVGYIKVCNGDYGATRWRGLNDIAFNSQTNEIVKSSAKINEYYLNQEDDDQKLYTLCHEIGHGFGLPHWDEDFFNKDLGNCMDYTNNPGRNMRPSISNFEYLAKLYGGLNLTSGERVTADTVIRASAEQLNVDSTSEASANNEGRLLQQQLRSSKFLPSSSSSQRRHLQSRVLFLDEHEQKRPRRVLYSNDHFEVHHIVTEREEAQEGEYGMGDTDVDTSSSEHHVQLQFYLLA